MSSRKEINKLRINPNQKNKKDAYQWVNLFASIHGSSTDQGIEIFPLTTATTISKIVHLWREIFRHFFREGDKLEKTALVPHEELLNSRHWLWYNGAR